MMSWSESVGGDDEGEMMMVESGIWVTLTERWAPDPSASGAADSEADPEAPAFGVP